MLEKLKEIIRLRQEGEITYEESEALKYDLVRDDKDKVHMPHQEVMEQLHGTCDT